MKQLTNAEKENYLSRLNRMIDIIQSKNTQIEQLRSCTTSISMSYDNEVRGTTVGDKLGKNIAGIIDLENELKAEIESYTRISKEIKEAIETLNKPTYKAVLSYRFLNCKTWEEVAHIMGYSPAHVYKIRRKALKEIVICA